MGRINNKESLKWLWVLFIIIFIIWFISPMLFKTIASYSFKDANIWGVEKIASFGDSFGSINALFSGLAFAGMIYAIILQRNELTLTREELLKSANAHIESEKALKKQVEIMNNNVKLESYNSIFKYNQTIIEESKVTLRMHNKESNDIEKKIIEERMKKDSSHLFYLNIQEDLMSSITKIEELIKMKKEEQENIVNSIKNILKNT